MSLVICQLLLATATGLSTRLASRTARSELLELLRPSASVAPLTGRLAELVQELELQGMVPATPAFLALGLHGRWQLRAVLGPDGLELPSAGLPLAGVGLGVSEQHFELDPSTRAGGLCGRLRSSSEFTLREGKTEAEPLAGRLQSEAEVFLTSHANTLHLKAATHGLVLPRLPVAPMAAVLGALHSQLSAEFRTDEGMRVSLQTMYLDERLHISRCTTRGLAGLCAVHVRPEDTISS